MRTIIQALVAIVLVCAFATAGHAQTPFIAPGAPPVGITSSSGNVAAATATATLPAITGSYTYICGFSITSSGSTAAAVVSPTIVGMIGGTMTFTYNSVVGVTLPNPQLNITFSPCMPSAAPSTAIVVSMPSLGAGNTNTTVNAWGFN